MRKLILGAAVLALSRALLFFFDSVSAKPLYYALKGITAINYFAISEKTIGGDRCTSRT
jgi:hypothetical protein